MTCSDNNNLVLVENNFCSCFKYIVFCETCFISWLLKNHKCVICRKKIKDDNNSIFNIIDILDIEIYHKILLKLENIRDNSTSSRASQNFDAVFSFPQCAPTPAGAHSTTRRFLPCGHVDLSARTTRPMERSFSTSLVLANSSRICSTNPSTVSLSITWDS